MEGTKTVPTMVMSVFRKWTFPRIMTSGACRSWASRSTLVGAPGMSKGSIAPNACPGLALAGRGAPGRVAENSGRAPVRG